MSAKNASSIQVCIKVRPCEPGLTSLWQVKEGRSIQLADSHAEPCVFDYVFDEGANNQEVFDRMARHIVHACMQGFNGTIFAYGQTSSGKTYTMMGDGQNPGVMVLAAKEIFQQISSETERDFLLRVGYIEIYNEKIYDLLNKKNQDLKIHESGNGIVNVNCEECIITSEDDLLRLLCMGNKERTVGETNMNERSSRSHAIFRIIIESRKSDRSDDDAVIQSVLNLVDLAGSERADQTGARGARLKEGGHINKSLLFLSNVIKSLSENVDNKFISFRDSKLTRILQASLGGNAFTSIICTIKPSIMEESQSTLSFATRAKKIRIKPQVNEMVSDATMMKRLEREIKVLKDKLAEEERKNESQLKVQDLERRIKRDMHKIISSQSLSDKCQQKRRRTWCPTASGSHLEPAETGKVDERLVQFSKASHLPKPVFFPTSNAGKRWDNIPKTINILGSLDIGTECNSITEEFVPAECVDFGSPHPGVHKPMFISKQLPDLTLTPMGPLTVDKIKKEIQDLQMFTSLEKHFEVECEEVQGLKEKLVEVTAQRDHLEQDSLAEKERNDALQKEVTSLTAANEAANSKISDLEEQLSTLKQTVTRLEVENQGAVGLEFEFEAHKKSSKLRVNDLLSALSEKELTIESLQKSLDNLSRDVLRNSKEDHMLSIVPEPEDIAGDDSTCKKCEQLEKLIADLESKNNSCECDELRSEIVSVRDKLESMESAFNLASAEVTQKTSDCERLSIELSASQMDVGQLQQRFDTLEQQWQAQQVGMKILQDDHEIVQEKYQDMQEKYEHIERRASASNTEVQRLQNDNTTLQAEIKNLKEQLEESQSMLKEVQTSESHVEKLQLENQELKAKISELEKNFKEMEREYDCLSNELMESVQENDALLKELRNRPTSLDAESMRSSGISTEFSEQEQEINLDKNLLHQFAKLSESIQQIELQHHSGIGRLFRANKMMEQGQSEPGLKLCLESAEYIEEDTRHSDTTESICLKGFLKRHRFQITRLSRENEEMEQEKRLLDIISQLKQEIEEKSALMEATEANINEMREQMDDLKSTLLEKSVIVNKVEDYQRQIESLEKQNAEMTMVYEELQDRVTRESSMSESLLRVPPDEDTLPGCPTSPGRREEEVVATLKTAITEMQSQVCGLQAELEHQSRQIQLKDANLAELQTDFEEMSERCLSMEVRLAELEEDAKQKQELLDRQAQKLSDDLRLIDQLQEKNAQLVEQCLKATESLSLADAKPDQTQLSSHYDSQIEELKHLLRAAKEELRDAQRIKDNEISALRAEFLLKIETNQAKFFDELQETKDRYESNVAALKEQLLQAAEKLSSVTARYQAELEELKSALQEQISQAEEERNNLIVQHEAEMETIRENLKEKLAEASSMEDAFKSEISDMTATLKERLTQTEEEREKASSKLEEVNKKLEQMISDRSAMSDAITELEKTRAEQDLAFNKLKMDNVELENQCSKIQEQLQMQSLTRDQNSLEIQAHIKQLDSIVASSKKSITELQEKCDQQVLDLDKLRLEKLSLESEIQKAKEEHYSTLDKLQEVQAEIVALSSRNEMEKCDFSTKFEVFTSKITDLEEALKAAQQKIVLYDDLVSQHESLKICLAEANELSSNLQKKVECLQSELIDLQKGISSRDVEIQELRAELKNVMDAKTTASMDQMTLVTQLKEVEEQMATQAQKFIRDATDLKGSITELQLKLNSLQETKDNLESGNEELKVKLKNSQNLRDMWEKENKVCVSLKEKLVELEESKSNLEQQLQASKSEIHQRFTDLTQEVELGRKRIGELTEECENLRSHLSDSKDSKDRILLDLQETKQQLEKRLESNVKNQKLDDLTRESEKLRIDMQNRNLEEKLRMLNDNGSKLQELIKECEQLRSTLKSKEASFRSEKERMDCTISSLLEDKRDLEEKLCSVNDIVAKLKTELGTLQAHKASPNNASFETIASHGSPGAPAARKSLDRNSGPRKSITSESEIRKNRRISVHDERRQSYWNDVREIGIMTDPVDNNCNCAELNCKLQDCQRELFIRESQVTALNMELKHHPLKDENAQLKKRVLEEQEKARFEQKRLKMKLQDLNAKISDLTDAAALSKEPGSNQIAQVAKSATVPAQTQTESDLEAILEKTNIKYQEALRMLRSRYNRINDLEEKLKQNENNDTSNITSLSAGQNSALKAQCESQKKEISTIKNKYESAKRILAMRKEELDVLREKVAKYETAK
ncbi:LOW QUALITY PROTEIN: kinesin-like protein KIN-7O [Drosophila teissieri]|uniref:LOW QUALITY PROTEIN: kinesin-like protein KIN-7O n=1 Tax=Drosophila teissieri TaxID=7243 RepID=UPI001CB9D859|nr:LOW QUALITY PROTEIN: kinesin-like protein KIN-7O [Drosophila teissieri]